MGMASVCCELLPKVLPGLMDRYSLIEQSVVFLTAILENIIIKSG